MSDVLLSAATLVACLAVLGCAKQPEVAAKTEKPLAHVGAREAKPVKEPAIEPPARANLESPQAADEKPAAKETAASATVAKDGTNFDPPVAQTKIPPGAWYCNMGTVHYARLDEGDSKCPRCGMKLHLMKPH